ncbi:MAG TPA: hypothetical protein ENN78_02105 [Candidatus Omnitrophica bacterium]|nr:hypothetical protein [Candidatus Omnitrophota bacterium]
MRKVYCAIALLLAVTACTLIGCTKARTDKDVVATVDGDKITLTMLNERIKALPQYYQAAALQQKKELLDDLIIEKLLYNEAKKRGIDKRQDVKDLVQMTVQKVLIAKLLEDINKGKVDVSEEEITQYYETHKDQYLIPESIKCSHILVETEEEAKDILKRVKAGEDFAKLARGYSKDLTKDRGGDLGYFAKGQFIPEFESAVFALAPGELSDVIKTRYGYHVVKVIDKRPARYKELEEAHDEIGYGLAFKKQKENFDKLTKSLKEKARITIYEEFLETDKEPSVSETQAVREAVE